MFVDLVIIFLLLIYVVVKVLRVEDLLVVISFVDCCFFGSLESNEN